MVTLFVILFAVGACLLAWAIWQFSSSPIQNGIESIKQWRRWHRDSLRWSRPSSQRQRIMIQGPMSRWQQGRKLRAIEKDIPELLAFLARAIRAGHSLTAAVIWAGETLPGAIGEAFARIRAQLQCGISLSEALNDLSLRYPIAELRMLVLGLKIAQDLGGPLPDLLDQLASNSRARLQLRAKVQALSAEARWSGWFLALLPIVLAFGLSVWRPDHMAVLWSDARGKFLSLAAISLSLLGGLWMKHLVQGIDRSSTA